MAADFDTTVEQLYAGPPDEFIAQRDAAAKQARAAGDKELADRIKQLRRPSAAAALINQFRRDPDRSGIDELLDLGGRLRGAQSTLDVKSMKSLSAERNSLITRLVQDIVDSADEPVSGSVREQLSDTFTAAVADADAGHAVGSGRLVNSLRYSGFGEVDLSDAVAAPLPAESPEASAPDAASTAAPSAAEPTDDATQPTKEEAQQAAERSAEQERLAAQRRLADARTTLSAARRAEDAALKSAELAERALKAARQTAKRARARAEEASAARTAAEESVDAAEADSTTGS